MSEVPGPESSAIKYDSALLLATEQDWVLINASEHIGLPSEHCYLVGDLAVLDSAQPISVATQADWDWYVERVNWLKDRPLAFNVRLNLIAEMAKVDPERAGVGLIPPEMDEVLEPALRNVLQGKQDEGLSPYYYQIFVIYADRERAKRVFEELGDTAWNSEKKYLPWLRRKSPPHLFMLFAALSEISQERTVPLMEKEDFLLALQGLAYYRESTGENQYGLGSLISHLAALKKIKPLFDRLFKKPQKP